MLFSGRHYDVLGLSRRATKRDIRGAYVRLAKSLHPDVNGGNAAASAKFKEVVNAHDTLMDDTKRALYDQAQAAQELHNRSNSGQPKSSIVTPAKLTVIERIFSPVSFSIALFCLCTYLFTSSEKRNFEEEDPWIEDCWYNPKTRRLEPPAPWDDDYKAAVEAGMVNRAKRHQLGR